MGGARFGLEHQVQRQAVLAGDRGELADDRDHQPLAVHVRALHRDLTELAAAELAQLLELLLVVLAVVRRRPGGLRKRVLLVPHQSCKRGVQLAEPPVQRQNRQRLRDVVEAGQTTSAALEAQGSELRAELTAVRRIAEEARDGLQAMRGDIETVREQSKSVSDDAAGARSAAEAGERRVEAMQAELTYALKTLEDVKAGLTSAGQAAVIARREAEQAKRAAQQNQAEGTSGVHEVFQQLLAAARGGAPADGAKLGRPNTPAQDLRRKSEAIKREPRHGFDDVPQPLAILGLDGRFRELNPAFARLVGYQEHAFAKAAWPSPHDRAAYQQQQEQLRQLASGEIDSVEVQSTYMHGQGLMVPVVGTLRAVPGEDGRPLHLLLEAEERHTG